MGKKAKEFKAGDFIFAKVKGYPAWPARVQGIKGKKYFVFFYGTREIANLPPNMIFDYAENKDKFLTKTVKRKDFNDGVKQIEHDFTNNVPLEDVFGTDSCFEKSNADITLTEGNDTIEESFEDPKPAEVEEKVTGKSNKKGVEDSDEGALVIDEGKKGRKPKPPAKSPKTPRNVRKALVEEEKEEEVVSRSGRKIKPKSRFIEEETEEHIISGLAPAAKKRRAATPDKKIVPEKRNTPDKKQALENKTQTDKSVTRYNTVSQSEIDDLKEPFNREGNHNILLAYLPTGKYIGVKLFQGRPTSFKNEAARLQWDKQAAKNAISLKLQLEKGEIKPESVSTQVETVLRLTDEEKANLDKDREVESTRLRVQYLKTEMSLIELDAKIKNCLSLEKADIEQCLKLLDELKDLDIQRLMLLKHPTCVQTVKRMRCYVGNTPAWDLAPDTKEDFKARAATIRQCADNIYATYRDLFTIPTGLSFSQHFTELVAKFKECTSKLTNLETLELVNEPVELGQPTKIGNLELDSKKTGKKNKSPVKRKAKENSTNKSDEETLETNNKENNTEKDTTDEPVEHMDTSDVNDNEKTLPIDKSANLEKESDKDSNISEKQSNITNDNSNKPNQPVIEAKGIDKGKNDKSKNKKAQESKKDKLKESTEKSNETNDKAEDTSEKSKEASEKAKESSDEVNETIDSSKDSLDKPNEVTDKAKEISEKSKETEKPKVATGKAKEITEKSKKTADNTKDTSNKTKETSGKTKETSDITKETSDKTNETFDKAKESSIDKAEETSTKQKQTSDKSKSSNQKVKEAEKSTQSNENLLKSNENVKEAIDKSKSEKTKDTLEKGKDKSDKTKELDKPKETVDKNKDSKEKSKDKNEKLIEKNKDNSGKKEVSDKSKDIEKKIDKDLKEKTTDKSKDKSEKQKESEKEKEKADKDKDTVENDKKSDDSENTGEPKAKRLRETRKIESKPEPPKTPTKKKTK